MVNFDIFLLDLVGSISTPPPTLPVVFVDQRFHLTTCLVEFSALHNFGLFKASTAKFLFVYDIFKFHKTTASERLIFGTI